MLYLDLDELPQLFRRRWFWSVERPNLVAIRRRDYLGGPDRPLKEAVLDRVEQELGRRPGGPVRMLTHPRYVGYCFNPVTFYYCFDEAGERVSAVVAEITNTPWKERHSYVLDAEKEGLDGRLFRFEKIFHVSPFFDLNQTYLWRLGTPGASLSVSMRNREGGVEVFQATLDLERRPLSGWNLARALLRFPLMTGQVILAIYWQALRLWLKRTPVFPHPSKRPGLQEECS